MQISLSELKIESRLRSIDPKKVEELMQSIQEIGLLNPITITKDNVLVAGAHRLEAMKRLGKTNIECQILNSTDSLRIQLSEIDENLIRNDLDYLTRGEFLAKRKEVYEQLYPTSKLGNTNSDQMRLVRKGKSLTSNSNPESGISLEKPKSFVESTSKLTNQSKSKISEEIALSKNIIPEVKQIIKAKELPKVEAIQIAKLEPIKQKEVMKKITSGETTKVKDAINLIQKEEKKQAIAKQIKQIEQKQEDKNQLICGDALVELAKLPDHSIDLLITDPPYGIDYKSNRSELDSHISKEGIANDGLDEAVKLLEQSLELLYNKMKEDCHLYIFSSWQNCDSFKYLVSQYFTVKNVLIWDKGNHGSGDLKGSWGNRYECIIFASRGKRDLNCRKDDIISVAKINSSKLIHPTQKPWELITQLLDASLQPGDMIVDPFMGSGSTIKAIKSYPIPSQYLGIELDQDRFNQAKVFIHNE